MTVFHSVGSLWPRKAATSSSSPLCPFPFPLLRLSSVPHFQFPVHHLTTSIPLQENARLEFPAPSSKIRRAEEKTLVHIAAFLTSSLPQHTQAKAIDSISPKHTQTQLPQTLGPLADLAQPVQASSTSNLFIGVFPSGPPLSSTTPFLVVFWTERPSFYHESLPLLHLIYEYKDSLFVSHRRGSSRSLIVALVVGFRRFFCKLEARQQVWSSSFCFLCNTPTITRRLSFEGRPISAL